MSRLRPGHLAATSLCVAEDPAPAASAPTGTVGHFDAARLCEYARGIRLRRSRSVTDAPPHTHILRPAWSPTDDFAQLSAYYLLDVEPTRHRAPRLGLARQITPERERVRRIVFRAPILDPRRHRGAAHVLAHAEYRAFCIANSIRGLRATRPECETSAGGPREAYSPSSSRPAGCVGREFGAQRTRGVIHRGHISASGAALVSQRERERDERPCSIPHARTVLADRERTPAQLASGISPRTTRCKRVVVASLVCVVRVSVRSVLGGVAGTSLAGEREAMRERHERRPALSHAVVSVSAREYSVDPHVARLGNAYLFRKPLPSNVFS
ncbi:hypothetical protein FB451DRAFT_1567383 [Mycena latifolia]|nr:hypothetical protein FB451DRAFT_1567383 [Mycena latifolia]